MSATYLDAGEELEHELSLLSELPLQVRLTANPLFDRATPRGSVAQKRGVICKLVCCGGQLDVKCNSLTGERACSTFAQAARMLRVKVLERHSREVCLAKAREHVTSQDGEASGTTVKNVHTVLMAGQIERQAATKAFRGFRLAEAHLVRCRAIEVDATSSREAAEQEVEVRREEMERFDGKRQKMDAGEKREADGQVS